MEDAKEKVMNKKELKLFRTNLRLNLTSAEARLWTYLKNKQVGGLKFRRQHSIDDIIVDFYCPELLLAIELDGDYHYHGLKSEMDYERDKQLFERYGIRVLRFENHIVFDNPDAIILAILHEKELNKIK